MTRILGLSYGYHDAGACLLVDGRIVAAAEEERFSRRKHDARFPSGAVSYCLDEGGIDARDLDHVIFYEKPLLKFERILASAAATFPRSRRFFVRAMQTWLTDKLWIKADIASKLRTKAAIAFGEHHLSHAASAYFPSPFDDAAVITADGVGEWATATMGVGHGIDLELTHEIRFPHSLGLVYSAFTAYLGFEVNEGEYKVMGMAAYGVPRFVDEVRKLVRLADDGSFHVDTRYFEYHRGLRSIGRAFVDLFGPLRRDGAELEPRYADIAASIQLVTEEAMLGIARRARALFGSSRLCLAGGVALNVLANARILREAGFDDIWIQPAAGDSGGCLGAATFLHHSVLRNEARHPMTTACLGPSYSDAAIHAFLERAEIAYDRLPRDLIAATTARLIADGEIVGWFQGRMEFGPRALGGRSILADPRDPAMRDRINEKIKHREQFRPFAPSVLREAAATYFDFGGPRADPESPYMLLVAAVRDDKRAVIPAVTHVDGTARVQTVAREVDPLYHSVIEGFGGITGVPVVVNTSFNVRGEPIVCTPEQAFHSFSHTEIDHLVMGDALIPASSKRRIGPYPGAARAGSADEVLL